VDFDDLILVTANWGTCEDLNCCFSGDFNADHHVGFEDLLQLISNWGACPCEA